MAKKPEGLSPNFNSIVSSEIPTSLIFTWTFIPSNSSDYQKNAEVKIYAEDSNTVLIAASTDSEAEVDLTEQFAALEVDANYEWEVKVTASDNTTASSGRKYFQYVSILSKGDLVWPLGPDPYEYIGTRKYFSEIQQNALDVLDDYVVDSKEEEAMVNLANNLFTGDIVPSRKDFVAIENILAFIATKENSYKDQVDELIEDGLGAEDIHKIYTFFDRLTKIPPAEPSNIMLDFWGITPLKVVDGDVYNKGLSDLSVDINWTPSSLETGTCTIRFADDLKEDIAYYTVKLEIGFTDYSCSHTLIFRLEDLANNGREIYVPMEHINFHHLSSSKKTQYEIRATATDQRGDESARYSKVYNVSNVPLGVASYQLRAQHKDLLDKKVIKDYYDIYKGNKRAYVHNVKGNVDGVYHYAVRLTDINGQISPWFYIPDKVKLDPLKPPPAPKPKVKSADTDSITFTWDYVKTADNYEIDPQFGSSANSTTTSNVKTFSSLKENTSYKIKIRAKNRAGSSPWVTVSGKTKARPIKQYIQKHIKSRTWRTGYYIHYTNGRVVRPAAEYRKELDNKEVIHGEWIELRNNSYDTDGNGRKDQFVKKGTKWGNHKSLYFVDYSGWKNRLKGKDIVDISFYIKRLPTQHGYPNDGRFLHVWTHNYSGVGSLPSAKKGPSLSNHYKVEKLDWNRGEGHWVKLPKSYGEKLRDGKIKGFAFYHPTSDRAPYSYMRFNADSIQFKIRYK